MSLKVKLFLMFAGSLAFSLSLDKAQALGLDRSLHVDDCGFDFRKQPEDFNGMPEAVQVSASEYLNILRDSYLIC